MDFIYITYFCLVYLGAHVLGAVKNLPAVQETWVQSLGQENPLEQDVVTHPSILAYSMPWTDEAGAL